MAATDQHYRNQRTLNILFAWSCVALLLSTVWMLWDDYNREPKHVQRQFRDVEEVVSLGLMVDALPDRAVLESARKSVRTQQQRLTDKKKELLPERERLLVKRAKADERFKDIKAKLDSRSSYRDQEAEHLGAARTTEEREEAQKKLDKRDAELNELRQEIRQAQAALDDVDDELQREVYGKLRPIEDELSKAEDYLKEVNGTFDRFAKLAAEKRWKAGDTFRNLMIIDGFASPTKINQITVDEYPINYGGFKDATRYDRCTTCHLAIDRAGYSREAMTAVAESRSPEKAIEELVQAIRTAEVRSARDEARLDDLKEGELRDALADVRTALRKQLNLDVTAAALAKQVRKTQSMLEPASWDKVAAALRRFQTSADRQDKLWTVHELLAERRESGEKIPFDADDVPETVREVRLTPGQVTQFAAHPRLDLFVDSNSPHPMEKFGCTSCHGGQGSSTSFQFASHTPNDAAQKKRWQAGGEDGYEWKYNHDWGVPMMPKRFAESMCLKCHHQVTDLVRHGTKEEAPKLLEGYNLVKENGCFGCHEIPGAKGTRSIGPDLRLEPSPPLEWLPVKDQLEAKANTLNPPGTLRKVGPSLRRLAEKAPNPANGNVNPWLLSWIKSPRDFRPDTKMPHFYGQSTNNKEYLEKEHEEQKDKVKGSTHKDQSRYPDAELYSIAYYLQSESAKSLGGEDGTRRIVREELEARVKQLETDTTALQLLRALGVARLKTSFTKRADLAKEKADLEKAKKRTAKVDQRLAELEWEIGEKDREIARTLGQLGIDTVRLPDVEKEAGRLNVADIERELGRAPTSETELVRQVSERSREQAKVKKELDGLRRRYRDLALLSRPMNRAVINDKADEVQDLLDRAVEPGLGKDDVKPLFARIGSLLDDLREKETSPIAPLARDVLIDAAGRETSWKDVPAPAENKTAGKNLFMQKGCLGCHSHTDAVVTLKDPGGEVVARDTSDANFGPELSRIGRKLDPDPKKARRWLVQWILNPNVHHPRTRMPVTHLSIAEAVQIADWLLSASGNYTPLPVNRPGTDLLVEMAEMSLAKNPLVGRRVAHEALTEGNIRDYRSRVAADADEQLLIEALGDRKGAVPDEGLMRYVGKKAIGRMGCYGCHDIPGFEAAKPIGTALNDWGKKDVDRLAFEDAEAFVDHKFEVAETRDDGTDPNRPSTAWLSGGSRPKMERIFVDALKEHQRQREGFLHLKLAEPRSYDYNRVRDWDDRLRMPQFKFARTHRRGGKDLTAESIDDYKARRDREGKGEYDALAQFDEARSREAVMTFILGLVAEPVPLKLVNASKPDRAAEVAGLKVIEKYNCAGCHEVRPGVYEFKIPEGKRKADFLTHLDRNPDPKDHVFPESTAWTGRPHPIAGQYLAYGVSVDDRPALRKDDQTGEMIHSVRLTEAFRFVDSKGAVRNLPAGETLNVPADTVVEVSQPFGGDFPRMLAPFLKTIDPTNLDDRSKQRSALPPPLIREGERVQPQWLFRFLLDPHPVRPWTVLRMPRFNMSEEEARTLVEYFAAVDKMNNPGIGLNESFAEVPQKEWTYWIDRNKRYLASGGAKMKEHVDTRRKDLYEAWERAMKDRITGKERDLEGAEAALKNTKDEKEKPAAKAKVDETRKELDELKDILKKGKNAKEYGGFVHRWESEEVYATDAHRLLTDAKSICMTCHSVGDLRITPEKGPNLMLGHERLRPRWAYQWIASPNRMFTYQPLMPQNFPKGEPLNPQYLAGPPREQAEAARDAIMNLPVLINLDANRYRLAPRGGK